MKCCAPMMQHLSVCRPYRTRKLPDLIAGSIVYWNALVIVLAVSSVLEASVRAGRSRVSEILRGNEGKYDRYNQELYPTKHSI